MNPAENPFDYSQHTQLHARVRRLQADGWRVVQQTPYQVRLRKPKRAKLEFLVVSGGGLLLVSRWFAAARWLGVLSAIIVLLDYLLLKEYVVKVSTE